MGNRIISILFKKCYIDRNVNNIIIIESSRMRNVLV